MSFRLVPNSVIFDDLERRNSPNRLVISPKLVAFEADYIKVVEDTPMQRKCSPKNLVFSDIIYDDIGRGLPPARALKLGTPLSLAKI